MTISRATSVILAALSAAGLATPAIAYDLPRAHFSGQPTTADHFRMLSRFSRCVADRRGAEARAALAMDARSEESRQTLRRLAEANWSCAPHGELTYSPVFFSSGLAEALMTPVIRAGELGARVALDPARPALVARDENEVMSLCTVRAGPAEVTGVLRTETGSAEEAAALGAVVPKVRDCLRAGATLSLNRYALRAILASSAYRLSVNNGWTPGTGR